MQCSNIFNIHVSMAISSHPEKPLKKSHRRCPLPVYRQRQSQKVYHAIRKINHKSHGAVPGHSGHCHNTHCTIASNDEDRLTAETVQGAALSLESVDDVQRGDSLALGVLGVCDGVTDDTLEEGLQDTTGLLIDHLIGC